MLLLFVISVMYMSVLCQTTTTSVGNNNKPSCLYAPNQTDFNACVFTALGGAEDQTLACALFQGRSNYGVCLCTKSKDVFTCYENYCPTDFSAPIFMKYFWNFCKAHESNLPLNNVAITGIPIVAPVQTSSKLSTATTSIKHSFFPSGSSVGMEYFSIWTMLASFLLWMGVLYV